MSNDPDFQSHSNDPDFQSRKPDYAAYTVTNDKDGKAYFNKIGVGWSHKDNEGIQIRMNSTPIDGCLTLRTLRQDAMQNYEEQRQQSPKREPEKNRPHER